MGDEELPSAAITAIDSSNVGFKLLKKCGWKEGTGLGASEQGILEPIPAYVKKNKRGIGADELKKKVKVQKDSDAEVQNKHANNKDFQPKTKTKQVSKRLRKLQQEEERMKEKEFERAFFREFWPDNV